MKVLESNDRNHSSLTNDSIDQVVEDTGNIRPKTEEPHQHHLVLLRRLDLLLLGVVLGFLGPIFVALAIPHVSKMTCFPDPCFVNPNYASWGFPVEIAGLALTVLGVAFVVLFVLVSRKTEKPAKN